MNAKQYGPVLTYLRELLSSSDAERVAERRPREPELGALLSRSANNDLPRLSAEDEQGVCGGKVCAMMAPSKYVGSTAVPVNTT